jgi:hypothetical protein
MGFGPTKPFSAFLASVFLLAWLLLPGPLVATEPQARAVKPDAGMVILSAQGQPLRDLLRALRQTHHVEIFGLDDRGGEAVTFSSRKAPLENAVKQLLRHLGEKNYVFEFEQERLNRVTVFSESGGPVAPNRPVHRPPTPEKSLVSVVRVRDIVEGSQAQGLDIKKGDLVLEYDGVRIRQSQELLAEVRKKADKEAVEMTLLRDGELIRIPLKGGFIGVRIETATLPEGALDKTRME